MKCDTTASSRWNVRTYIEMYEFCSAPVCKFLQWHKFRILENTRTSYPDLPVVAALRVHQRGRHAYQTLDDSALAGGGSVGEY